ncbi:MAG: DNA-binding protein WhiA, partial [Erysipelotrichales bacterium]|nr:DNA-binding protein WhiA [Erysipelotrichales bacterium]
MTKDFNNEEKISFTHEVKNEICLTEERNISSNLALLSAFIKVNGSLLLRDNDWVIQIKTENKKIAKLIFSLTKSIFKSECRIIVSEKKRFKTNGNNKIILLEITNNVKNMLETLQIYNEKIGFTMLPKYEFLQNPDVKRSYIAGTFLASGSVNSPYTSNYHLEVAINSLEHANLLVNQLSKFYINGKIIKRRNQIIVYLKKSEQIADFLRVVG